MSAAERFFRASTEGNLEAATAEFAPDVVMLNPATDDEIRGKDAVAAALGAVEAACDEFRHTHLLVDAAGGPKPVFGLVYEAVVGDARLEGVDLLELDDRDRIASFRVSARPMSGLMALGARMSGAAES
ncbi:MAG: nuclear transport factor 2 family protein [Actinomycetota bacterium]|nr:nuclear transport factor 2 family protein [Actinomycetota bacterium]